MTLVASLFRSARLPLSVLAFAFGAFSASAQTELVPNGSMNSSKTGYAALPYSSGWMNGGYTAGISSSCDILPHNGIAGSVASPDGGTWASCIGYATGYNESFTGQLQGGGTPRLAQGQTYVVRFFFANFGGRFNATQSGGPGGWRVYVDNNLVGTTQTISVSDDWYAASFSFTPSADSYNPIIKFAPTTGADMRMSVDGISVLFDDGTQLAPVINSGVNQTVASGSTVNLGGTAIDFEGDTLSYSWTVISTTSTNHPASSISVSNASSLSASLIAPSLAIGDASIDLNVRLTVDDGNGGISTDDLVVSVTAPTDAPPVVSNLDTDSAAFTEGATSAVLLDAGSNATASDAELDALNSGNGDYAGASITVSRNGGANSDDVLGFDFSSAGFTVSGSDLQVGGQTFATFTNTGGMLTVTFTSSAATATTALVSDVLQSITYSNSSTTPPQSITIDIALSDGISSNTAGVTVVVTTIPPVVTSVTVPAGGAYKIGDNLDFTVNTDDAITVDTTNGVPSLAVNVNGVQKTATFVSGSDSTALLFRYTVASGDGEPNGVTVGALSANSGTLKDAGGTDLTLTFNSVGALSSVFVDGKVPTLVSSTPTDNATNVFVDMNEKIDLRFSENAYAGSGNVLLYKAGGTLVSTFDVTNSNQVRFDDNTMELTLSNNLEPNTAYYIQIDATAVEDGYGNAYAGIADTTTLNFNSRPITTNWATWKAETSFPFKLTQVEATYRDGGSGSVIIPGAGSTTGFTMSGEMMLLPTSGH